MLEVKIIINLLTAIGNDNLNNLIKQQKEFVVLEKDFLYKEAVLEYLEINKNVDIIILYEKLPGEIYLIDLVRKIKLINSEICIFIILESKNEELEKLLKIENIKKIFYNDEINLDEFITCLKNIKLDNSEKLQEEILLLKKLINQKDEEILSFKNSKIKKVNLDKNKKIFTIIENNKIEINKDNINKLFIENKINLKKVQIEINNKIFFINKKIAKIVFKKMVFN